MKPASTRSILKPASARMPRHPSILDADSVLQILSHLGSDDLPSAHATRFARWECEDTIGALIIRIGLAAHYTTIIIRNPQNSTGNA